MLEATKLQKKIQLQVLIAYRNAIDNSFLKDKKYLSTVYSCCRGATSTYAYIACLILDMLKAQRGWAIK